MTEFVEAVRPLLGKLISSTEKYLLLSCQIPAISSILHCLKATDGNHSFAKNLAKSVKASMAIMLDLRFRATVRYASGHVMRLKDVVAK